MYQINNLIKARDNFGHTININFDKNGDTYQTNIGGCLSILIKIAIFVYIYSRFHLLVHDLNDSKLTEIDVVDIDSDLDFKDVSY